MKASLQQALVDRLLALADDEIILGHRDSEWTGHAPILEEDIALANIAQDEIGHAAAWYGVIQTFTGDDPDRLVFFRDASGYRCVQMVELPKGDWAFTMTRQYLFDAYEMALLARLQASAHAEVAAAASKIRTEEIYHYRHSSTWVRRLGLGTAESQQRMQRALDELWPYTGQLFEPLPGEAGLVQAGLFPDLAEVQTAWMAVVAPHLRDSGLRVAEIEGRGARLAPSTAQGSYSRLQHSPHLTALLHDMQFVARSDAQADW